MNREMKALLLNAFVCPGSGHLLLGKKWQGWGIVVLGTISLTLMMTDILSVSQQIADGILAGRLPLDPANIIAEVQLRIQSIKGITSAFWLLIATWAIAVLDSIRIVAFGK
ncbi:MAG: hypothetical protein LPD71_09215 [Shewanella sp.]|nr:hypothetical protein [Shewanella sp.]MCF1429875.1 hypothetical protein [Shewanella sp.]MCF1438905.1 hypothetical protein [Shewanella sp.]MCF1457802.1 hypothetical protein [Shewanella sp.]